MSEFKSWRSFWDFSREVKHQSRFLFDQDVTNFLDTILVTSNARKKLLKKEATFGVLNWGVVQEKYIMKVNM